MFRVKLMLQPESTMTYQPFLSDREALIDIGKFTAKEEMSSAISKD